MIDIGDLVSARIHDNITVQGHVRYTGKISGKPGSYMGLELVQEDAHHGKNDGCVFGQQYFACVPGSGIFVSTRNAWPIEQDVARPDSRVESIRPTSALSSGNAPAYFSEDRSRSATPSSGLRSRPSLARIPRKSLSHSTQTPDAKHEKQAAPTPGASRRRESFSNRALLTPSRSSATKTAAIKPRKSLVPNTTDSTVHRLPLRSRASLSNIQSTGFANHGHLKSDEQSMPPPVSPSKIRQLESSRLKRLSESLTAHPVRDLVIGQDLRRDKVKPSNLDSKDAMQAAELRQSANLQAEVMQAKIQSLTGEVSAALLLAETRKGHLKEWVGVAREQVIALAVVHQAHQSLRRASLSRLGTLARRHFAAPVPPATPAALNHQVAAEMDHEAPQPYAKPCPECAQRSIESNASAYPAVKDDELLAPQEKRSTRELTPSSETEKEGLLLRVSRLEEALAEALQGKEEQEKYYNAKAVKFEHSESQLKAALRKAKQECSGTLGELDESRRRCAEIETAMKDLRTAFEEERQKVEAFSAQTAPSSSSPVAEERPASSLGMEFAVSTAVPIGTALSSDANEEDVPCDDCGEIGHRLEDCPYAAAIF